MPVLFFILMLAALICFILSWPLPNVISPILGNRFKKAGTRTIFGILTFIFFVISVATSPALKEQNSSQNTEAIQSVQPQQSGEEKQAQLADAQEQAVEDATKKDEAQISVDTSKIQVTFDTQDIIDGKQKTVVWTQNDSENIFSGNLFARAKGFDDSTLGSDTFIVENLLPGQKIFGILWSKPSLSATYEYKWSSANFKEDSSKSQSQSADSPYKLLKEKKESGGTLVPQIEFYLATDKNFDKMYEFLKSKQINKGIFYHAVFVDNEKYAEFSKYPITAMFFEGEQAKHIVATYWYNTQNGNREFTSYEKNSRESIPQTRRD